MLALGGLCPGSCGGMGAGFETVTEASCKDGFWKNEAEVVYGGGKDMIKREACS